MINRSAVKHKLKKILPTFVYVVIVFLWNKLFLFVVTRIEKLRLRSFTEEKIVLIEYSGVNFQLLISPENGFIDNHIFLYGTYEPFILDIMKQYLQDGMTFVDVGANIGQHSIYATKLVGKSGSVHSFEPITSLYTQLLGSVASNHCETTLHAYNHALGNKESEETLYISHNRGGSSLVTEDQTEERVKIAVKRGDDVLRGIPRVDCIKIDVEGYELEVLEGMKNTLTLYQPVIIIEFSANFYINQEGDHGLDILNLLSSLSYSLYDVEDAMKEIKSTVTFNELFRREKKQTNLLCLPKKNTHAI